MLNSKKFCTLLLFTAITVSGLFAQSSKLKQAKKDMEDLDYISAIAKYQQILQKDENPEAIVNLAECYRKINDTENAEYWYGQVVRLPEATSVHKLYYGSMLQVNGKCDLAKEWYDQYTSEVPDDARGQYLSRACDYEDELMTKNAGIYEINHMPFNSNLDDYSPAIFKDQVIFASDRDKGSAVKRSHMWTGNPFAELYSVSFKEKEENPAAFQYGRPDKYSKAVNTKFHEAAVSYAPDGKTMYFTRNNYLNGKTGKSDEGVIKLKIFYGSAKGENEWSNLESLPFNSDEYSVAHPAISADGEKLYFASDMPGGFGAMDLYVSEKEGERWGPPVNLGPTVNTEGSELFPFSDKNGRLYFASDGQIGLGGLDVYYTTEKAMNEWNVPVNLGYPINTNHDDFGITFGEDGTWGYITSDREGGAGRDDIYGFKKVAAPIEIFVYDAKTNEPIEAADVLFSMNENILVTGADGKATLDMKLNECASFTATAKGYEQNKKEACTKEIVAGEKVIVSIPMEKVIQFDIEGIVFDMTNGLPAPGAKVSIMDDCKGQPIEAVTTDETGRYRFKLDGGCCYTVKAEKEGFIAGTADNNCTKGLDKKATLNANLNLTPYGSSVTSTTGRTNGGNTPNMRMDVNGQPEYLVDGSPNPDFDPTNITTSTTTTPHDMPAYSYNPKSGLYETPDGQPANLDLPNGQTIRKGVLYINGEPAGKPGEIVYENNGDGGFLLNIYYDFNRATIRNESESELNKLLRMMNDNPDFVVELASHTDSRGSDGYNASLSQRRANAVVKWLTDNGVNRDRLIPVGYGETKLTNDCINRRRCDEKEHQLNRRTEFRILGCKGGSNVQISQPKVNPKLVPCKNCPF